MSFKKTQRLCQKKDYNYVFKNSKKIISTEFIILYSANNLGYPRLGLAIAKKIIAKSHDRNRIKRLIRESFRKKRLPAVDLVFLVKRGLPQQSNFDINFKLNTAWENLIAKCGKQCVCL